MMHRNRWAYFAYKSNTYQYRFLHPMLPKVTSNFAIAFPRVVELTKVDRLFHILLLLIFVCSEKQALRFKRKVFCCCCYPTPYKTTTLSASSCKSVQVHVTTEKYNAIYFDGFDNGMAKYTNNSFNPRVRQIIPHVRKTNVSTGSQLYAICVALVQHYH